MVNKQKLILIVLGKWSPFFKSWLVIILVIIIIIIINISSYVNYVLFTQKFVSTQSSNTLMMAVVTAGNMSVFKLKSVVIFVKSIINLLL